MDIQEINQSLPEFLYQMLGRLEADCLYYLGNGGRFAGHLWAGNEREQIKLMRMIYRRLCEIGAAPEWMSEQQIQNPCPGKAPRPYAVQKHSSLFCPPFATRRHHGCIL